MATFTPNYGLHQWEPQDNFLRTDFNTDFQKIDTAINTVEGTLRTDFTGNVQRLDAALATLEQNLRATHSGDVQRLESSLSTAQQTLRNEFNSSIQQVNTTLASIQALAEGRAKIVFGTYTGTGTTSRNINLGAPVKWVLLATENGNITHTYGGLAAPNYPAQPSSHTSHYIRVSGNNIQVFASSESQAATNSKGMVYYYLAAV